MFNFKTLINKIIFFFAVLVLLASSFHATPVYAVCTNEQSIKSTQQCIEQESKDNGTDNNIISNFCGKLDSEDSLTNIAGFAGCIAASLAFVILVSAIVFMVYGAWIILSDPDKGTERGRKIIFSAVMAMIVSVLSFSLAALITNVLAGGANGGGATIKTGMIIITKTF